MTLSRRPFVKGRTARAGAIVNVGLRARFDFGGRVIREIWSCFQDSWKAPIENMRLKYRKGERNWWKEAPKESGRLRSKAQVRKRRASSSEREMVRTRWPWKQVGRGPLQSLSHFPCERGSKVICREQGPWQSVQGLAFVWWGFE